MTIFISFVSRRSRAVPGAARPARRSDRARRALVALIAVAATAGYIPSTGTVVNAAAQGPQTAAPAAPVAVPGTKEIETQLIPVPRATSPGSAVRLVYSVINYEETDVRVRLRVLLPAGWTLLDDAIEAREFLVEAFDEIDGEILVAVARDARVGDRQLLKLVAEVTGEAGVYEGQNFVSITRTGGVRPGVAALTGSTTVGVSRVGTGMTDARTAGGVALAGKLDPQTTVTLSAGRDMADNLTNYRYNFEPVKVAGGVRRGGLDATFGNAVFSSGNAITGPFVRGRGASIRRLTGRFLADLTVAQPTTYAGEASGRLVRGRAGLTTSFGSVSIVASDFSRPAGYTTLLPTVVVLDPDEAERQEIERRLAAGALRNRVLGGGLEGEFHARKTHRVSARAGALHLSSANGLERTAPAAEASYGYSGSAATLNLRWRETPPSLQGVQIGGDDVGADGTIRLHRDVRFVAQAFQSRYEVTGQAHGSMSSGGAVGTRFTRGSSRLELRGNYRESAYDTKTTRRTGAVYFGVPAGPFSLGGNAELGETDSSRGVHPLAFYRADLRITRDAGTFSFSVSRITNNGMAPMQRADILASRNLRGYELAGGAWVTRGYRVGGHPGAWTTIGVPTPFGVSAVAGVEYAPLSYIAEPGWRASFMLRRPLVVPLNFLRSAGA